MSTDRGASFHTGPWKPVDLCLTPRVYTRWAPSSESDDWFRVFKLTGIKSDSVLQQTADGHSCGISCQGPNEGVGCQSDVPGYWKAPATVEVDKPSVLEIRRRTDGLYSHLKDELSSSKNMATLARLHALEMRGQLGRIMPPRMSSSCKSTAAHRIALLPMDSLDSVGKPGDQAMGSQLSADDLAAGILPAVPVYGPLFPCRVSTFVEYTTNRDESEIVIETTVDPSRNYTEFGRSAANPIEIDDDTVSALDAHAPSLGQGPHQRHQPPLVFSEPTNSTHARAPRFQPTSDTYRWLGDTQSPPYATAGGSGTAPASYSPLRYAPEQQRAQTYTGHYFSPWANSQNSYSRYRDQSVDPAEPLRSTLPAATTNPRRTQTG